jgi:hypothetical protein
MKMPAKILDGIEKVTNNASDVASEATKLASTSFIMNSQ